MTMTMMMMILMIDWLIDCLIDRTCCCRFVVMLFGVLSMLCPSCLHPLCFLSRPPPPPFNDVYRVPDAFLQLFGAMTAWEHSLSSVACCNATLKIQFLFWMVEVEVRGASAPDFQRFVGSALLSSQPKDQDFMLRCRSRSYHVCLLHCRGFRQPCFTDVKLLPRLNSSTCSQKKTNNFNLYPLSGSVVL